MKMISTIKELKNIKSRESFSYICRKCGKITVVKTSYKPCMLKRYSTFECPSCYKYRERYIENNIPLIDANSISKIDKLKQNTPFKIKCSSCGRIYTIHSFRHYRIPEYKRLLCRKCSCKIVANKESTITNRFKTNLKRYGVKSVSQAPKIKDKIKSVKLKRYGDPYYTNRKKAFETLNTKYGINNPNKVDPFKSVMSRLDKYGSVVPNYKYNYYGIYFDSSWELAVWIYYIDNNIPIIRNSCTFNYTDMYNRIHYYQPDFIINSNYVEVKGPQFWNNGNMIYPYNKKKVNGGVWIPLTKEEKEFMDDLYERKHQCGLSNNVLFLTNKDILPYLEYCNNKYPNWNILFRKDNIFNPSYYNYISLYNNNGITPFDINKNDKYIDIKSKGITPYDIKQYND